MDEELENIIPLSPSHFFQVSWDCPHVPRDVLRVSKKLEKKHLIPDTSLLLNQEMFAEVSLGWNEEGLYLEVDVAQKMRGSHFPEITMGDAVEVMIDTRDIKTSGYNTKFCHHFFFLPESVDEIQAGEITRFRSEDAHLLCDPEKLQLKVKKSGSGYQMEIFLSKEVLYGYDPSQFQRLGFTYRISRKWEEPQHFSCTSTEFVIEEQPSLWSTIKLVS
jgi:hypothetical protein